MNARSRFALAAAGLLVAAQAGAEVVFYEHEGFHGRNFTSSRKVGDFSRFGFNDRASSVVVFSDRWEVCEHARFDGHCIVLRPGRYPSLSAMGLNDRVSSARILNRNARVSDSRYAPAPLPVYDNRRRNGERLYEANVTSARAVLGPPEQRCWVEREQVAGGRGDPNVGGAIVGAILGGVLGHQVGSGRGNDAATAGGAIAGAVVGSNVNRGRGYYTQDVRRCTSVPSQDPVYWDVTYEFRGQEHRIQTAYAPGPTVTVNGRGEPRAA